MGNITGTIKIFYMILSSFVALFLASIIFGILGPVVIWKKFAYFGDGLAHAMILGVALSYLSDYNFLIISSIFFSLAIIFFRNINQNSVIGMMSQAFVSIAIIIKSMFDLQIDFESTLFGDVLLVGTDDLTSLIFMLILVLVWIRYSYKAMLLSSLNTEIFAAYCSNSKIHEYCFVIILGLVIAASVKIFGALMVTSFLLIPAINAKIISSNPKSMIYSAILISMLMNFVGFFIAYKCNLPISPVIILFGLLLFFLFSIRVEVNS